MWDEFDIFAKIENQSKVSFGLRTVPFGKLILEAIVCQRQCLLQAFVRPGSWSVLSEASSAATCALGSALGSEDVGGVGGLLLDLGAFFARQLPPEGQVGGFSRRPSPLNRSAVAAGV